MPRLSLWNKRKGFTYKAMDHYTSQQFKIGGTSAYVHKYAGPVQIDSDDKTVPNWEELGRTESPELNIQDIFFMENRDRIYEDDIYEVRIWYQLNDNDFDLSQFGFFLPNDIIYASIHMNDTVDTLGRKIMSGDVLELPHLRDDLLLDPTKPAVNKYFVVSDVNREASGYSPTWYPHILRLKLEPMPDSQEYADILDKEAEEGSDQTLRDILSTYGKDIEISDMVHDAARKQVSEYNLETAHIYYVPGDDNDPYSPNGHPWIYTGDGEPPNGAELLGKGNYFPDDSKEGEYWLRTDYTPNVLFRREGDRWARKEVDLRRTWKAARFILESFINNDAITTFPDGDTMPEKQPISKAIKPKADM